MQLIRICKGVSDTINNIRDAVNSPPIQLSQWKAVNPDCIRAVLVRFIGGMLEYYGRSKDDMSNYQVVAIVNDILEKYYYYRIEDVCLCFKRARQNSKYKDFYGRIDGSVIMSWFATYDKERDEVINSMPQGRAPIDVTGEECSYEEYREILEAKVAGGDLYANQYLRNMRSFHKALNDDNVIYGNYKYHRKHKYDNR